MKRLATSLVLIPLVLVLILRGPLPLLAGVTAMLALLGTRELLELAGHYGIHPLWKPTYVLVVVIFAGVAILLSLSAPAQLSVEALLFLLALATASIFILLALGMSRMQVSTAYPAAATSLSALLYVAFPLVLLVMVRELWAGGFLVLYLLLTVWAGDIFAYYAGRAIGRHKLAPRISPGKTWEGSMASFAGSIFVGWAVLGHAPRISAVLNSAGLVSHRYAYMALEPPAVLEIVALSAGINLAAQFGDLVESLIKRGAGVKDSGTLLPGHGGLLDRIDALLFAAPVLWFYATLRVTERGHL